MLIVLAFCVSILAVPQPAAPQGTPALEGPDDAPYYFLLGRYLIYRVVSIRL